MGVGALEAGAGPATPGAAGGPGKLVLAVYRDGRSGRAAVREGAELAASGSELVVVTLVPQSKQIKCCRGNGAGIYNCAIQDVAREELAQARELLGSLASRATFAAVAGTPQPDLRGWAAERGFRLAVVPRERFSRGGGRAARELRAAAIAVRLVG